MAPREAGRGGHGGLDDVDELLGRLKLGLVAAARDGAGDRAGVALLTVLAQQAGEAPLVPGVDDVGRRQVLVGVHAHVERRVVGVGEAAVPRVDLQRRHAEVQDDDVGAHALVDECLQPLGERRALEPRLARDIRRELGEVLRGGRVAVDADQHPAGAEALGDQPRVAGSAGGGTA